MAYDYDIIIIGGGSAGLSLASGAAQLGVKVLLLDKEMLGGDCLHYGCVPSKTLLKSAHVASFVQKSKLFGINTEFKGIDWESVTKRITSVQDIIQDHDSSDRFHKLGCDVVFGTAIFQDPHTIEVVFNQDLWDLNRTDKTLPQTKEKTAFTAKKIVIATGTIPFVPPLKGLQEVGFVTNETLFTMPKQPESLLVIGGGVIGVEMAQAFAQLGTKVYVSFRGERILGQEDKEVSEIIMAQLESDGVTFLPGTDSESFQKKDDKKLWIYKEGEESKELLIDEILMATGRKAALKKLHLDKAGVVFDRFITVDKKCRTSQKHITAIGDINGNMPFTHGANYEAGLVLSNEILHVPSKANYDSIGYTIYTQPEISSIGKNQQQLEKENIKYTLIESTFEKQDRALTEEQTNGAIRIFIDSKDNILGCQIVSPRAGEMIREWQLAMANGIKLSKIARSTYIYPTFGEISKWAAGSHYAPKLFSPKVKKVLRGLFGYRGKR